MKVKGMKVKGFIERMDVNHQPIDVVSSDGSTTWIPGQVTMRIVIKLIEGDFQRLGSLTNQAVELVIDDTTLDKPCPKKIAWRMLRVAHE
jgi:hypothetical protein